MGCRAVIVDKNTTKENANQKIGVYLHWYGSRDTVERLLQICKDRKIRNVISDPQYGWARLCQAFADKLTQDDLDSGFDDAKEMAYNTGIGIGIVSKLDCRNYDNGVYYIDENFDIVKHTDGSELEEDVEF